MLFKDDDKFLVNRDGVSYYAEALELKNIVNPTGTVDSPDIITPIEGQGTPVPLDVIEQVVTGANTEITLLSNKSLNLLGPPDTVINTGITQTQLYRPITTDVDKVEKVAAGFELYFRAVNYDFKYFKVGETLTFDVNAVQATIVSINTTMKTITVTSPDLNYDSGTGEIVPDLKNDRCESEYEYQGTGNLVSYTMLGSKAVLTVSGATDFFVSKYNNRNTQVTIDTDTPVGGSKVPTSGFTFTSSPFSSSGPNANPYLQLTKVIWYINGVAYNGNPPTDGIQSWDPGSGVIQEGLNTVQVKYEAGLNFGFSSVVRFEASSTARNSFFIDRKMTRLSELENQVISLGL